MKNFKNFKVALFVSALALFSFSAVNEFVYKQDDAHSRIGFTITHLGIADIHGQFDDFETNITGSKVDFSDAVFEFSAKAKTINTHNKMRDEHLSSGDFFNVKEFDAVTFKSTSVKVLKGNKFQVMGDLTMHGVTKPVTLDAQYNGSFENPKSKKVSAGFKFTGTLKRSEFGIGPDFAPPMISDEVKITADLEFIRK